MEVQKFKNTKNTPIIFRTIEEKEKFCKEWEEVTKKIREQIERQNAESENTRPVRTSSSSIRFN